MGSPAFAPWYVTLRRRTPAVVVVVALATACSEPIAAGGRHRMARDPGSRHGLVYVQDAQTGQWVDRECELRVAEARALPESLVDDTHGSRLSVSIFKPETVESGLLLSTDFARRDGFRVWRGAQVLDADDLAGRVASGVQVEWPQDGKRGRAPPRGRPPALTSAAGR